MARTDVLERTTRALRVQTRAASACAGHAREGSTWLAQAIERSDGLPPLLRGRALHVHGILLVQRGELDAGRERLEAGLTFFREVGDETRVGHSLNSLATVAYAREDFGTARRVFEEVIALRRESGDRRHLSAALSNLGAVLLAESELAGARPPLEEALALDREFGDEWASAVDLGLLAGLTLEEGEPAAAAELQHESLSALRRFGDRTSLVEGLERSAAIAAALGSAERAARLAGAAEAERAALGEPAGPGERALVERHLTAARARLGEDAFEVAAAAGRLLRLDEALAAALEAAARAPT